MGFTFDHTVRFQETDAAGVVYFANGLTICHAAYEASLAAAGMELTEFFSPGPLAYPIVRATIDFQRPMRCGDQLQIRLTPLRVDESTFEVNYQIARQPKPEQNLAQAVTCHVCIDTELRHRQPLPAEMEAWIQRWAD